MRFLVAGFVFVLLLPQSSHALLFRQSSRVTSRPTLCSVLMKGMGRTVAHNENNSNYLYELGSVIDEVGKSVKSGKKKSVVADTDETIVLEDGQRTLKKTRIIAKGRLDILSETVTRVSPDVIAWGTVVRGKEAVLKRIEERTQDIKSLESQVRQEAKSLLPNVRRATVAFTALNTIVGWALYSWYSTAVHLFLAHQYPQSFTQALFATVILYKVLIIEGKTRADVMRQFGVFPVDVGPRTTAYEGKYFKFLDKVKDRVEKNQPGYVLFSDWTRIAADQFGDMKEAKADPRAVAISQSLLKLTSTDSNQKGMSNVVAQHQQNAISDPRWYYPCVRIEDILFTDQRTQEPVLMTFLRFYANPTTPPKKPKENTESEGVKNPELTPEPLPVPAGG